MSFIAAGTDILRFSLDAVGRLLCRRNIGNLLAMSLVLVWLS